MKIKQENFIHQNTLLDFANLVSQLDGDLEALLNTVNISIKDLSNPKVNIPYNSFVKLIESAAVTLNYPAFGMRLSASLDLSDVDRLISHSRKTISFQEALISTQQFLSFYCNHSDCWELTKDKHLILISRYTNSNNFDLSVQEKELSYGIYLRVLQKIIGHSLKCCRVEFTHNNITKLHQFKKLLKADVAFNQECERIIIDSHYINQHINTINISNCQDSNKGFAYFKNDSKIGIEQQVKNLIMQNMINKTHTIENIASRLDMHSRSLQRRLEEKNLTFKQLLNELRIDVACWHLRASNKSVTLISEILGYNEVSSFSRTFKKQKKCSALQWRKSHALNAY